MIDVAAWEQRLRDELERCVFNSDAEHQGTGLHLIPEAVRLEGSYPDTEVVILFRERRRPECLLGYRWRKFWDWVEGEEYVSKHGPETPESMAIVIWANWEEAEVPETCVPGEITWIR